MTHALDSMKIKGVVVYNVFGRIVQITWSYKCEMEKKAQENNPIGFNLSKLSG
jgi:hypothetical protein